MRLENRFYEVRPAVVPADAWSTITISPLYDHVRFAPDVDLSVRVYPCEQIAGPDGWVRGERETVRPDADGRLRVRRYFAAEQEHVLLVAPAGDALAEPLADFRVYSLQPDLMRVRPWKGDLHMHSTRSDGREAPAYVAAASRRIGLDFMAVTDHRRYEPSMEAQAAFANAPIDLRICRGEEVHPPQNPVHIVSFAGAESVNARFAEGDPYHAEVEQLARAIEPLPSGVDAVQAASCLWCFRRIREVGGLAIFCHPYWFTDHTYAPAGALTTYLFDHQPFDAYEVIGGYYTHETESNALQIARYHEERAAGRHVPVVGVSDAHGCERNELFGWYYTIVFAATPDPADVIGAVRALQSVAVEAMPGQPPRAVGPFRLVKLAHFLMREVFPAHDALCATEGDAMMALLAGREDALDRLGRLRGQCDRLYAGIWGAG